MNCLCCGKTSNTTDSNHWHNFGCHNTDAHLRSSIIGRNVTIVVADGEMDLGEFGRIHFIDWDQTRARKRTVQVMIIGE